GRACRGYPRSCHAGQRTWMPGTSPGMTTFSDFDVQSPAVGRATCRPLDQLPLRQILHQRADAEGPGLALVAGPHAVDEFAELGRRDRDDVVALVGEPLPRRVAILNRCEHGPE